MALIALLALGLCVPFLGKAFHIDDPLVVWTGQQILTSPLDFYGYAANWYGTTESMAAINQNPPGAAYYAAIFGAIFGWGEVAMHASVALLFACLVCGVYLLARQMGAAALMSALVALFAPGVFVSAGTVMTDLPMTTCWVWGVTLWVRGLESKSPVTNGVAAVVIALGVLTKYFAISLVPLLLVFTAMSGRRAWPRAALLLIPVLALAGYEWFTHRQYGVGHFLASVGYASGYQESYGLNISRKVVTGLAFLGAGAAPDLFLAPVLWRGVGRVVAGVSFVAVLAGVAVSWRLGWNPSETGKVLPGWFWVQYAVWIFAGLHVLALVVAELWERRDRWSVLLGLWIVGTLFFGMFLYHFVNIRVLLPALPAVALLCGRRLATLEMFPRIGAKAGLAVSLVLSLLVALADAHLADAGREAAAVLAQCEECVFGGDRFEG